MQLQLRLDMNETQDWLTTDRKVLYLLSKIERKSTNVRSTLCLPLMWKIFTAIFIDKLYDYMESEKLLIKWF